MPAAGVGVFRRPRALREVEARASASPEMAADIGEWRAYRGPHVGDIASIGLPILGSNVRWDPLRR